MERVARHKLVWLNEAGWRALAATCPRDDAGLAQQWARAGWPAVVRRRDAGASHAEVCLGIPAPPEPASGAKRRFGFRVPVASVADVAAPPRLHDVAASLPPAWQRDVRELCAQADHMELRTYGSTALAYLTGLPYLTARSDIDLTWKPASPADLNRGVALLAGFAQRLPLDGEIEFPGEQSVSWKEWHQAAGKPRNRVLVKDACRVRLVRVDELMAALENA